MEQTVTELNDTSQQESAAIDKSWYTAPLPNAPEGWLIYNKDFVLAALQGCMADPTQARPTSGWMFLTRCVMALMAVAQAIIMLWATIPLASWFLEIIARTFSRNSMGFFLRGSFWKSKLKYLGQNTIIDQNVEIWGPENVSIGSHCHIDTFVRLGAGNRNQGQRGSIKIGNFVHLGPGVHIAGRGGVEVGDLVGISANAHIYSATGVTLIPTDPGQLVSMSHMAPKDMQHVHEAPVVIEDFAFVGIMARVMPGVTIGRAAIIHANTEITRSVPAYSNFGGIPRGRHIGWRKPLRPSPRLKKSSESASPIGATPTAQSPEVDSHSTTTSEPN